MSTLSSIPPRNKGFTTSSMTRTSAVLSPRQLAPTMGPAHAGIEILGGAHQGMEGFVSGRITRSRCGKLYIDDSHWGPDSGSRPGRSKSSSPRPIDLSQSWIWKFTWKSQASSKHALGTPLLYFITGSPEPTLCVESLSNDTSEETSDATSRPSDGSSAYAGSIRYVG